jgi:hypothetical protein
MGINRTPISSQPLKYEKLPAGKKINMPTRTTPRKNLIRA